MTNILENTKNLLTDTKRIAEHQEEIKRLKGESFNVFSILKIESRENETHSALIGELLNPNGSHLLGPLFLDLFLDAIGHKSHLNASSARVVLEKPIGLRNDNLKFGGRIDIFISDTQQKSICIENKIYAADQNVQIERYVNYNRQKNIVYYLTLDGRDPSKNSCGDLKSGEDFHCISYETTILNWLHKCLKESVDKPILRETIRQYIILIKKLTNQLTDVNMEKDIIDLIHKNYNAAKYIQANVHKAENMIVHQFLDGVKKLLQNELDDHWITTVNENLTENWKGISVEHKTWNGIYVRLQGEPKLIGGPTIYGIVANKDEYNRDEVNKRLLTLGLDPGRTTADWPYYKNINLFQNGIDQLFDANNKAALTEDVFSKLLHLAKACEQPLAEITPIKAQSIAGTPS